MRRIATAALPLTLLLSACEPVPPVEVDVQGALRAGSGIVHGVTKGVHDTVELGRQTVEKVEEGLTEAQRRAQQIQEGARKIEEGRRQLQEGLTGKAQSEI